MDAKHSDATRYLCAAACLDRGFRNYVLDSIFDQKHRAVSVSPGVDLVPVAKICLATRGREGVRDLLLFAALCLLFVAYYLDNSWLFLAVPVATLAVVFWDARNGRRLLLANRLSREHFDPDTLPAPSGRDEKKALDYLASAQEGNVVVYSGFSPFVGSGRLNVGGWSFAIDTRKPRGRLDSIADYSHGTPKAFETRELYDHIDKAIRNLQIPDLMIEDKLYVNGKDIRSDKRFLDDPYARPNLNVSVDPIDEDTDHPGSNARYYKCIRIPGWGGEIVVSVFLRFSQIASSLFIEANYFLLTSMHERYHEIDRINPRPTLGEMLRFIAKVSLSAPILLMASPLMMVWHVFRKFGKPLRDREISREIGQNMLFDYGAGQSAREMSEALVYRRYFEKLDYEMYVKILQRHFFDRLVEFLDVREIDTSDLKETQTMIINSGVIVSGGDVRSQTMTVGQGASVSVTTSAPAARPDGRSAGARLADAALSRRGTGNG